MLQGFTKRLDSTPWPLNGARSCGGPFWRRAQPGASSAFKVSLIIGLALLSVGVVVQLVRNNTPSGEAATKPAIITGLGAVADDKSGSVVATPDLTKIDPHSFLDPIPVGKTAPDFMTKTALGQHLKLSQFKGKKDVIMIFYQGHFCHVCAQQLMDIQAHYNDFKANNAEILAISADDKQHAMMTVAEMGLSFPVLPDPAKNLINRYGVANIAKEGIAWPSVFVVDRAGNIQLSFADKYGKRLHTDELLPIIKRVNASAS
jgi:peroxiredoxin